jgi:putative heme-binding domain-containing protein
MRHLVCALVLGGLLVWGTAPTDAQPDGGALFRERCADCHGADAKGVRGPDLTRLWNAPNVDERVFQTIRNGIPGSIMPPSSAPDVELRAIITYLRSISTARNEASTGNVGNGQRLFDAQCASCHRINDRGGDLGPDLSRIAASQSNQVLTDAIRNASASFTSGYEPVTIVMRDGQRIQGTRKSEDAFSIQIMDTRERLQGYVKTNVREVIRERTSLMPDFGVDRLSNQDLDDVIAYLATFRAAPARGGAGGRGAGGPGAGRGSAAGDR